MIDEGDKYSYVLQGWPTRASEVDPSALVGLPGSEKVRAWCQAGKKVRVTFEVVQESL